MSGPPHRSPPPPPRPAWPIHTLTLGERMNDSSKQAIADMALGILEEQVQARIVHYKSELATNPELDAITAQVVEQVKRMRDSVRPPGPVENHAEIEAAQERHLTMLLTKVFPSGRLTRMVEKSIKQMLRALAKLFFESELGEKTLGREGDAKLILHGEQAIFYVLMRYQERMSKEFDAFEYADPETKQRALDGLAKLTRDMQDAFLARRSNALKRMVGAFQGTLIDFFIHHLPKTIPQLAKEVIVQAGTAHGKSYEYRIATEKFSQFRTVFERRFMIRLVSFGEDELVRALADTAGEDRDETLKFITDPNVFSVICGEMTGTLYDYLCNEGFLDIPADWRHSQ